MNINKAFILNIFKNVNIQDKYKQILVSEEALNMYKTAFTSKTVNPHKNYEIYEFLGDAIAGQATLCYFYNTYPQLQCESGSGVTILSRLKIVYLDQKTFGNIAEQLGFLPHIIATKNEFEDKGKRVKLLEDVFEAFIGATHVILQKAFNLQGVSNQIIYDLITDIFNRQNISFDINVLYDAKTRLKELFDNKSNVFYKTFGCPDYSHNNHSEPKTTILKFENYPGIYFVGEGPLQQDRDKHAAEQALSWLKQNGFQVDKRFAPFCTV